MSRFGALLLGVALLTSCVASESSPSPSPSTPEAVPTNRLLAQPETAEQREKRESAEKQQLESGLPICDADRRHDPDPPGPFVAGKGGLDLELVGQIGGPSYAVALSEDHVLISVGSRIEVLDADGPDAPRTLGASPSLGDVVRGLAVSKGLGVATLGPSGVAILDLSTPDRPRLLARLDLPGIAESVAMEGNLAFVADGPSGLQVLDVSAPATPRVIGTAVSEGYAMDVALHGTTAYVAAGARIVPVDVSVPAAPTEAPSVRVRGYGFGLAVIEGRLAVAAGWEGLQIFDITDAIAPRSVGQVPLASWAMGVAGTSRGLALVAGGGAGISLVDLGRRERVAGLGIDYGHAANVAIRGDRAFVADLYSGLKVADLGSGEPRWTASHATLPAAYGVSLVGDVAYVGARRAGLHAIDVSDPTDPERLGVFIPGGDVVHTVSQENSILAITMASDESKAERNGFQRVDAADPRRLQAAGEPVHVAGHIGSAAFEGEIRKPYGELADGPYRAGTVEGAVGFWATEWGLLAVHLADPACELSFLLTSPNVDAGEALAVGVDIAGSRAYVAVSEMGLYTVDISDVRSPKVLSRLEFGVNETLQEVLATQRYVFALTTGRFVVVDTARPDAPGIVGSLELPALPFSARGGAASSLAVADGRILVADGPAGVLVIDVSVPSTPRVVQQIALSGSANSVVWRTGHAFVAGGDGGLSVLRPRGKSSLLPAPIAGPSTSASMAAEIKWMEAPGRASGGTPTSAGGSAPGSAGTCVVRTTDDDGSGSLRHCLTGASEGHTITFDPVTFPASRPGVIHTLENLRLLGDRVTIDATQAGVVIDGSKSKGWAGLEIPGDHNVVKGLRVQGYDVGVFISGTGNVLGGPEPSDRNIISGNHAQDVELKNATATVVQGNFIGTSATGAEAADPPARFGALTVWVRSSSNRIERSVIVGAIHFADPGTSYNDLVGNLIGVDASGTRGIGGETTIAIDQPFNRVGGTAEGEGNVINGTLAIGAANVFVLGNQIGTDVGGRPLPTSKGTAVSLGSGASYVIVGGPVLEEGNSLASAEAAVIQIEGYSRANTVIGNQVSGGAWGVRLEHAQQNFLQRNTIAGSTRAIGLYQLSGGNTVRANQIERSRIGVEIVGSDENVFSGNVLTDVASPTDDRGARNTFN